MPSTTPSTLSRTPYILKTVLLLLILTIINATLIQDITFTTATLISITYLTIGLSFSYTPKLFNQIPT